MPKRLADVMYRGKVVPQVPITCLASEIELRIRAAVLQRAVALYLIPEMAAERMLCYFSVMADKSISICTDVVAQAALFLCGVAFSFTYLLIVFFY